MVRGGLSTAGLKDLLDGHRTKPVLAATNEFGYKERSISTDTYNDENTGAEIVADIMFEKMTASAMHMTWDAYIKRLLKYLDKVSIS